LLVGFSAAEEPTVLAPLRRRASLLLADRVTTVDGLRRAFGYGLWDLAIVQTGTDLTDEGGELLAVLAERKGNLPVIVLVKQWDDPTLMTLAGFSAVDLMPYDRLAGLPFAVARALRLADARRREQDHGLALQRKEELIRALTEDLPLGVLFLAENGHCTYASPGAQDLLQRSLPQCHGGGWMQAIPPAERDAVLGPWRLALAERRPHVTTFGVALDDGQVRWIRARSAPLHRKRQRSGEQVVTLADISELLQTQSALRRRVQLNELLITLSAELFNAPPQHLDELLVRALGQIGQWADVDRGYLFQFTADDARFSNTHEWCRAGVLPQQSRLQDLPATEFAWFLEQIRHGDIVRIADVAALPPAAAAERREFQREGIQSLIAVPVYLGDAVVGFLGFDSCRSRRDWPDETGTLLRLAGNLFIEALSHHQTETSLKETRFCVDHVADAVFWVGENGRVLGVNDAAALALGYHRTELLQLTVHDIDAGFPRAAWPQRWAEARSASTLTFETRHRRRDGQTFPVEVTVNSLTYQGQPCLCAMARDISERQRAAALETRLAAVVRQSSDCILITDHHGIIQYANPAFERQTGYSAQAITGQSLSLLQPDPNDQTLAQQVAATVNSGTVWRGRCTKRRQDGSLFESEGSVSPVCDGAGHVTHHVVVARNITRELEFEQRLLRLQKMEALGRLAGGVAHDFNNLLTVITGSTSQSLAHADLPDAVRHDLERIRDAATRATSLTRHLLALSGKQVLDIRPFDLNTLVQRLQPALRRLLGSSFELTLTLTPTLPIVKADSHQIGQALLNLAIHARESLPPQHAAGRLTIATNHVTVEPHDGDIPPGQYILLQVADNGPSLTEELKPHVFEPFSTQLPGRGLGLASVYGIVTQNRGHISVDSAANCGTVFSIWLPISDETPRPAPPPQPVTPAGPRPTILLVEDEPSLREMMSVFLGEAGYQVRLAASGVEALTLTRQPGNVPVDLLLTDIMLPGLDGPTMAAQLRAQHPNLPVLFMSGYAESDPRNATALRSAAFLAKPFTRDALLTKVASILAQPG
jgi:PAS domain S-box-containing protein